MSLEVIAVLPDDFDLDNDIDGFDFVEWQRRFGGVYDSNDLAAWESNYGAPLSATLPTVPEPSCFGLLLMAAVTVFSGAAWRHCECRKLIRA